ncbi:OmpA family protein [uncultured Tenacibaculum sp.]|uniref:OmpA family protein n=1 Tax=uncultured Tenacibaculum sp. TaxID=174713 RepID=UPI002639A353|nr:OmpA family protein [uncultured Tenacibaculum sp.]
MKKSFKRTLVLGTVLVLHVSVFSQNRLLKKGNEQYDKYEYINAQNTYLKVVDTGFESSELFTKLGNSYYFNSQFENASKWYKILLNKYGTIVKTEYFFRYAQTLKAIGNYKEADLYMHKFSRLNPEDKRAQLFLKKQNYLKDTNSEVEKYRIKNLEMNSSFTDFGTTYYGDYILFSSSRKEETSKQNIHEWNKELYLDFYKGKPDPETGDLYEIEKWDHIFNSDLHESTPVFTKNKKIVYFTRNNEDGGSYDKLNQQRRIRTDKLKIYRASVNARGEWTEPEPLPFNSDSYSIAHPALSNDGKKLYFSSDMPGGKGESDIYEVEINSDGSFGVPINLGATINTEGKETFPFISANNDLYFSSDGHVGLGGLDIFKVKSFSDSDNWKVENVGKPINSRADDFAIIMNKDSKKGYFSSNRKEGKGKDDIYSFARIEIKKKEEPKIEKDTVILPKITEIKKGDDLGKTLVLNPIYFDFDKSFIRPDAAIELDKILAVLKKYPSIKIQVRSHTDSRAIWYYNTALSKRRAKSTREYLIKNGINRNRITSRGYGESRLLNKCKDYVYCTEEEHQLNRRSEFIVIEK